ncbi:MAG: sugar-binding domain-containing protein, partial [Planctomycetota bacterium]
MRAKRLVGLIVLGLSAAFATGEPPRPATMDLPLPEHPRPQLVRPEWMNLNGEWQFALDPNGVGLADGWAGADLPGTITVPYAWTSKASGIDRPDYGGAAWYRRTFDLPPEWIRSDQRVFLHVDRADYRTELFMPGPDGQMQRIGEHEGGYTSFSFDITDHLSDDGTGNVVALRVVDEQRPEQPTGSQGTYTSIGGIYGTVWLELAPKARIVALWPDGAQIEGAEPGVDYEVVVGGPAIEDKPEGGWPMITARNQRRQRISWDLPLKGMYDQTSWTPDSPGLVPIEATLRRVDGDGQADTVHGYFARGERPNMAPLRGGDVPSTRQFVTVDGQKVFLRGAGYSGYWPTTLATPPSDEAIRNDLTLAKQFGLNALRCKGFIPTRRMVHWADLLGVVLMVDLPSSRSVEFVDRPNALRDWPSSIDRIGEHWIWVEPWDRMCHAFIRQYRWSPSLWMVSQSQSRLPIGDVGYNEKLLHWLHWRWHDLYSWGRFLTIEWHGNSGRCIQPDWWDLTVTTRRREAAAAQLAAQLGRNRYRVFEEETVNNTDQRAETILVSDFGRTGWWTRDTDLATPLADLAQQIRSQTANLSGIFWTDLTDTEWEKYGLLNYDRSLKVFDYDHFCDDWSLVDLFRDQALSFEAFSGSIAEIQRGQLAPPELTLLVNHNRRIDQPIHVRFRAEFRDSLGRRKTVAEERTSVQPEEIQRYQPQALSLPSVALPTGPDGPQRGLLVFSAVTGQSAAAAAVQLCPGAPARPDPNQLALTFQPGDYHEAAGEFVYASSRTGQQKAAATGEGHFAYRLKLPEDLPAELPLRGIIRLEAGSRAGEAKVDRGFEDYWWYRKENLLHEEDYRVRIGG